MKILSQTKDIRGFHGEIGKLTNMYDSNGNLLYVGDLVAVYYNSELQLSIEWVCEEDHRYANWTSDEKQYVMGIAGIWNNNNFDVSFHTCDEFYEMLETFDKGWYVKRIKSYIDVVENEKWGFISVVTIPDEPNSINA
jgi:hypothetical protein